MTPDSSWWEGLALFLIAQTALIVGVAMLVNFKIGAAQARRSVWQAAMVGFACIWIGELAGAGEQMRAVWPRQNAVVPKLLTPSVTVSPVHGAAAIVRGSSQNGAEKAVSAVEWPGAIWLTGTVMLLLWAVVNRAWLALQRRKMPLAEIANQESVRRLGVPLGMHGVEVRVWPRLRGPAAFGWWRPTVALPNDFQARFTVAQREAMLAHELAHLAARDPLWLLLTDVVCALAWWNPLVWVSARRLREACETAADEASALVPTGPLALAESLVHFGRELVAPPMIRGLGVGGSGIRSGLGRRVNALLASQGQWRGLSSRWRWWPRIVVLIFALLATWVPVWTSPTGSLAGWLVDSAAAETAPIQQFDIAPGTMDARPFQKANDNNGEGALKQKSSNTVLLTVRPVTVREGSPAQLAADKLFSQLPPDQAAGADAIAKYLKDSRITHTENLHLDYRVAKDVMVTLTGQQFKQILTSFEQTDDCNILSTPKVLSLVGQQSQIAIENVETIVTGLAAPGSGTNGYMTEPFNSGITAKLLPNKLPDGWDLLVLCRWTQFLGYDNPNVSGKGVVVKPLPHIRVHEVVGQAPLQPGQTLFLRGAVGTQTNKVVDTVLGIFHKTHVNVVHNRLYVFVTPTGGTNQPPSAPR